MIRALIQISDDIEKEYLESLKEIIESLNNNNQKKDVWFTYSLYTFKGVERDNIQDRTDSFLIPKFRKLEDDYDSIICIPNSSINLQNNYLWYSYGNPQHHVMVISSYLYKNLIKGRLNFGAYVLLLYCQFLARYAIEVDDPHIKSRKCLNDHCGNQIEILNVLKNKKDVLCDYCLSKIEREDYHQIIKGIISWIKQKYYLKRTSKKIGSTKLGVPIIKPKDSKVVFKSKDGYWYEFEIYMAKKCANLSELYEKLDKKLSDPDSEIEGYSLYEVGGGYRGEIELKNATEGNWKNLRLLRKNFGDNDFKDVIRPLIEKNNKKCVVYDENSIVLRIIFESLSKIHILDKESSPVAREITEIFEEILENEQSILFTLKELYRVGDITKE